MNIDVTDSHIRYLGYHIPIDLTVMPPGMAMDFQRELEGAVDLADGSDVEDARKDGWGEGAAVAYRRAADEIKELMGRADREDLSADALVGALDDLMIKLQGLAD